MKHTIESVRWASYDDKWEGPVVYGAHPYRCPPMPSWAEKVMYVVSATEGNLDSVNMYDRAVCSVGVIQWTELSGLNVSNLLGVVAESAPHCLDELKGAMSRSAVTFAKTPDGPWRFRRGGEWLDSVDRLRGMYLAGSGLRGRWSREQRDHARAWCAGIANVFTHPEAQAAQVEFTAQRIESFALRQGREYLFDGTCPSHSGIHGAARAAYLSYAVNLPVFADRAVTMVRSSNPHIKWSEPWFRAFLRTLVFGQNISIWPARYDRIRPRLESVFGVNLPDFAEDFRDDDSDGLGSPAALQAALTRLGFDPGPVDGVWGKRSEAAVRAYQRARNLAVDGQIGPLTRAALARDLAQLTS